MGMYGLRTLAALAAALVIARPVAAEPEWEDSRLMQELAAARAATARYHNMDAAIADGFRQVTDYVPHDGIHYVRDDRLADGFDPAHPEVLVYAPGDGGLRLVAVEYRVESLAAPAGFAGTADRWVGVGHGTWVLHAWIWLHNPNGLFADSNPMLPRALPVPR